MTVALYARVSTTKRKAEAPADYEQDPEVQLVPLRELARQRGWAVVGQYIDRASGAKETRPDLTRLLEDARRGKFGAVAVWRFDRFARSSRHLLNALEEFRVLGIQFLSLRESLDTSTPIGKATVAIAAAFAELERDLRVQAGIARRRDKGLPVGRQRKVFDRARAIEPRASGASWRAIGSELGIRFRSIMLGVAFRPSQRQRLVNQWTGLITKPGAILRTESLLDNG